ncbi:unnamed protein product [Durusdinium trenchii]|uniref:K Homology domain-containing protein n=1 Tax=Durusdinium trenchii TaxID=1381693 RepID=A0ABP0SD08_9DINO
MASSDQKSIASRQEGEAPATLADKIVIIAGSVHAKDAACREVIYKLRQMQGVKDLEPGVFVIIIPQISVPVVIGTKGAQIKAIMEKSGAEINVGREAIIGMPDQPISINGTVDQVVLAVSGVNSVLQDMMDRGKLKESDFRKIDIGAAPMTADTAMASWPSSSGHGGHGNAPTQQNGTQNTSVASVSGSGGTNGSGLGGGGATSMPSFPGAEGDVGGMGKSEQAFFSALQASGINSAELTILLPSELLHTVLVPRGIMSEVAQRSGSRIDVGAEGPAKMLQVTLHGQMVGNAMAALLLQEKVLQWQSMK